MAIKAGLVGVNPKGVDHNGMPIASGGNSVKETQLTANGKKFFFAYDETSEKYGYKLDGAGDFIPFESAGGGPGWVKPAELSDTGLEVSQYLQIKSGGYYVDSDNGIVVVDIVVYKLGGTSIAGFPFNSQGSSVALYFSACSGDTLEEVTDNYVANAAMGFDVSDSYAALTSSSRTYNVSNTKYAHVWGFYYI